MRRIQNQRIRRSTSPRSGVTLIEVLVTMFVLTIGILGVIAALPIGIWSMNQAKIADRSAACARGALEDISVRGLTDTDRVIPSSATVNDKAYAIDPRMYNAANKFPFDAAVGIQRCTLTRGSEDNNPMHPIAAERLFVWGDQIRHTSTSDEDSRPEMLDLDGVVADTEGEFSWMMTFSGGEATIVVFQNRVTDYDVAQENSDGPATEREVNCEFVGGGFNGGEVILSGNGIDLDLSKTRYIMLHDGAGGSNPATVCQWYEILYHGDVESGEVNASLSGPDWQYDPNSNGNPDDCKAVICDGVTAAFTTVVDGKEPPWLWND